MTTIGLALVAAIGVHLLIPRTPAQEGTAGRRRHLSLREGHRRLQAWLTRTGLGNVSPRQFLGVSVSVSIAAAALWGLLMGPGVSMLAVAAVAGTIPTSIWRRRHCAATAATLEAWPRMIEEIRVRVGSVGQPIPQALLDTGLSAPEPIRAAFVAAQREWTLTTDFGRVIGVLKDTLADPTADTVCETLLVVHDVGGDLDTRLEDLASDRRADLRERREADARSAGARLARWFVVIVPAGMAFAGLSLGDGRSAYTSPAGQAATAFAVAMVAACWWWAGRIMATPPQRRVFDR